MIELSSTEKAAVERIASELREFTGLPQWTEPQQIQDRFDSLSWRLMSSDSKKYALILPLPSTDFEPEEFGTSIIAVLEKAGLYQENQLRDSRALYFTPLIPGDHPSCFIVRGQSIAELKATAEEFKKRWKELPSFESHFLASKTASFLEWLKPMVSGADIQTLGNVAPSDNTRLVNSWLKQLTREVTLKRHPKIADQAREVLRIVRDHTPDLKERIEGLYDSRVPVLHADDSDKVFLTDEMEIRKAEKNRKIFMLHDYSYNWYASSISAFNVSYYFHNRTDAEEFRLHAQKALYEIAESEPEFRPIHEHDRPYLYHFDDRKEGILSPTATSVEEDGNRFRVDVTAPLDLNELWDLDKKLAPYIKPTAHIARQMLATAKMEYRGAVGKYDPYSGTIKKSEEEVINRGNVSDAHKKELLAYIVSDIAGMMVAGSAKPEETIQQVMNAAWWTMYGFVVSDQASFAPMPALLPGAKESPAKQELGSEIQKRAAVICAQLEDMMRQSLPAGVDIKLPSEASPIERLSKLAETLRPHIKAFDRRQFCERYDENSVKSEARRKKRSEEWGRLHPGERKPPFILDTPDRILALSDALARLGDPSYDPSQQLKSREKVGNQITPFGEGEPPLVERVYHFADWDNRKVTYISRAGSRSLQPPRLQLREELQAALDKESPAQEVQPLPRLDHGKKIADGVTLISPETSKRTV